MSEDTRPLTVGPQTNRSAAPRLADAKGPAARDALVRWLDPATSREALPPALPSPFDEVAPGPLVRAAAEALMTELRGGAIAPGVPTSLLDDRREGGKMFGVLVVEDDGGRLGVLRAFSGQLGSLWTLPGWAPPLCDLAARAQVEPASDVRVKALTAELEALTASPELLAARARLEAFDATLRVQKAELKQRLAGRKSERHARRQAAPGDVPLHRALDEESKRDDLERRKQEAAWRAERDALAAPVRAVEAQAEALERARREVSQVAMRGIHDTYVLTSARGERRPLRALFPAGEPPWGAADCAAPKLVGAALALGLRPRALAEFWWGPPPPGGGRVEGAYYPACREKCGPVLPFLLDGLDVAPRQTWRPRAVGDDELVLLFADARLVVVSKPSGLLSVPARDEAVTDNVEARLRARFPGAACVKAVHRLDLDTSGVLVVALDDEALRVLQAQFAGRAVEKRYVAWLEGAVDGERGVIELPLRLDVDQRPLQVVDPLHGKPARTEWSVLERRDGRTKVAFVPRSGRTHQLRVHAAHAQGLAAPIVGDRLYGHPAERLLLHAEAVTFTHPGTGERLTVSSPAPF